MTNQISKTNEKKELGKLTMSNVIPHVVERTKGIRQFPDYDANQELLNAMTIISEDPKLQKCDATSVYRVLTNMVSNGMSIAKNQMYLIPYGNKLNGQMSYFGHVTALKRIDGVIDIQAEVIREDENFDFETTLDGSKNITQHDANFETIDNEILGAYAVIKLDPEIYGRDSYTEVMSIKQIQKSWGQGQMKGGSPAHKNFPEEMCKKSVIARACKLFVKTSVNSKNSELVAAYNQQLEHEDELIKADYEEVTETVVSEQNFIDENTNQPQNNVNKDDYKSELDEILGDI